MKKMGQPKETNKQRSHFNTLNCLAEIAQKTQSPEIGRGKDVALGGLIFNTSKIKPTPIILLMTFDAKDVPGEHVPQKILAKTCLYF